MQSGGGKTKLLWGPGQGDLFKGLYSKGGPLQALLTGAPDLGYEVGVNRGMQQLTGNLAQQGLFGSPLGAKAAVDYAGQAAVGREQNRLQTLLGAARPFGGGPGGGGGGLMSSLGL